MHYILLFAYQNKVFVKQIVVIYFIVILGFIGICYKLMSKLNKNDWKKLSEIIIVFDRYNFLMNNWIILFT